MKKLLPWIVIFVNISGTVLLGLKAQGIIQVLDSWQILLAMGASVSKPVVDRLIDHFSEGREASRLRRRRSIDALVLGGLVDIIKLNEKKLPWDKVGISVFVVRRRRLWFVGVERLDRVTRAKVGVSNPSSIVWTRGKGVIGECWETGEDVGRNFARDYALLDGCTRPTWDALSADFRQGLSYEEFLKTKGHGAVVAVPILNERGRFRGCVSIDAPGDCYDILWSDAARRRLYLIGKAIDPYL